MRWYVRKSCLKGEVRVPPSKSQTLRALLFALMARGTSRIVAPLEARDTEAMVKAIRQLGAQVDVKQGVIEVEGVAGALKLLDPLIDAGNSGLVLRFIGALVALTGETAVLTGDASICSQRPVLPLLEGLGMLGAYARTLGDKGYAPIVVRGPLKAGRTSLHGKDSPPVSALLVATSFLEGKSEIAVHEPGELPWIDLTLAWLARFGRDVTRTGYTHYTVMGRKEALEPFIYEVPGDFSSAAFPVAAALTTRSQLHVTGLDWSDLQGDKALFSLLGVENLPNGLIVHEKSAFQGGRIEMDAFIDALPVLAALGPFAEKGTQFVGAENARTKESDRIAVMARELTKMGAVIEELPDGLKIEPGPLKGAHLLAHGDHRVAMALAVAALGAEGESCIEGVEAVEKTYPGFCEALQHLGAEIRCG